MVNDDALIDPDLAFLHDGKAAIARHHLLIIDALVDDSAVLLNVTQEETSILSVYNVGSGHHIQIA